MIRIRARRRGDGLELSARGHAGYASPGQDIVCAGVSALLFGYIAYLEGLSPIATAKGSSSEGETPHLEITEGDGYLRVRTRGLAGRDVEAWRVTEAGLSLIVSAYPAYAAVDPVPSQTQEKGERYESKPNA